MGTLAAVLVSSGQRSGRLTASSVLRKALQTTLSGKSTLSWPGTRTPKRRRQTRVCQGQRCVRDHPRQPGHAEHAVKRRADWWPPREYARATCSFLVTPGGVLIGDASCVAHSLDPSGVLWSYSDVRSIKK